jgi:Spy/CpxP family protein refolding chaperone
MVSLRRLQLLTALPVVVAFFGITGCGGDTASAKASDPTEEAAQALTQGQDNAAPTDCAADGARGQRPPPGGGGPDHLLMAALHELTLTDAQKSTIEGLLAKNGPGAREHGPQDRVALTALTESVRAGKIDAAAVIAKIGANDRGPDAHLAETASALQTLHTTLTKEQRRALVDSMTARMADHGPPPGAPPQDKGARGPDGARGPRDHGPGGPGGERFGKGGPLGHMLDGLSLTDAQRTSIDSALAAQRPAAPDHEAMKKGFEAMKTEMSARLESFAADTFDAKAFLAPPANAPQGKPMMHPMARMVNELAVVVPLLDATQRETLAAQLEKGPPMGPPGGRERGSRGDR